jgi:hypothetical protein
MSNQESRFLRNFNRGLAETETLRKETSLANVGSRYIAPSGFQLGQWQYRIKRRYRERRLARQHVQRLKSLGFDFSFGPELYDILNKGLRVFLAYKKERRTTYIPEAYVSPTGFKLGAWLRRIRYRRRRGILSQKFVKKLNQAGFQWGSNCSHEQRFALALRRSEEYKKEHGTINAPNNYLSPDGFCLGQWQSQIRHLRRRNCLSPERIEALNRLGFRWETPRLHANFERGLVETRRYKKAFHKANAPVAYRTPEEFRLGGWQVSRKREYRENKLSQEQIKSLKNLGFNFDIRPLKTLQKGYEETLKVKERTGNPNVVRLYKTKDGFKLGIWQAFVRCKYQARTLAKEIIRRLEKIGFTWHLQERAFQRGYRETLKFRKLHKAANCPRAYVTPEGYRLGLWQGNKKIKYHRGILPLDRIQKLEAIGFDWGKPLGPSGRGLQETAKYLEKHGTANVPRDYVTAEGYKLGEWQANTRYLGRVGRLSKKRMNALKDMGFDFSIRFISGPTPAK